MFFLRKIISSAIRLQYRKEHLPKNLHFSESVLLNSRMPRHSCCEVRVMQLHDILLLRTSAILPEAISAGGLTPTTDTSLFLTTYKTPLKNCFYIQYIVAQNIQIYFILYYFAQNKDFFSGVPIKVGVISQLI